MTMNNGTYHYLSCNAQIANLLFPTCRTVSASVLDDKVAALEAALKVGWTENAGRHMCPECSRGSVEIPVRQATTAKPRKMGVAASVAAVAEKTAEPS